MEAGGRLVLDEAPLIVAAGADVERTMTLTLGIGAVAALRETVILGRDGERPGRLSSSLRATLGGRPLLHDGLRLSDGDAHVALPSGDRVLTTICLLGLRPEPEPGVLALEGPGALSRFSGTSLAGVDAALGDGWDRWSLRAQPREPVAAV